MAPFAKFALIRENHSVYTMRLNIFVLALLASGVVCQYEVNSPEARLDTVLGCLEWDLSNGTGSSFCYYEELAKPCYGVKVAQPCTVQLSGVSDFYPPSKFNLTRDNLFYHKEEKVFCVKPALLKITGYLNYVLGFEAQCRISEGRKNVAKSSELHLSLGCLFAYSLEAYEELDPLLCCHQIRDDFEISESTSLTIAAHSLPQRAQKLASITTNLYSLSPPSYRSKNAGFASEESIRDIKELLDSEILTADKHVKPESWSDAVRDLLIIVFAIFLTLMLFLCISVILCQKYPAIARSLNRCCPVFNEGTSTYKSSISSASSTSLTDSEEREKLNDSVVSFNAGDVHAVF